MTHGAKMGGHVVHAALERAKVDADEVEDVIIGCANPRRDRLEHRPPDRDPRRLPGDRARDDGQPLLLLRPADHRLASQRILAGEGEVFVAGGVESISMVQNEMNKHHFQDEWLHRHKPES